ncbi:SNF2 family N-terminal domain-containing protein [Lipomyces oligophaga]|uniref:SNF2 family N-terminal domain-containing protein n=1 Tax=Lipomyces oligophaga TaxID=45792 RepID=UPI0034CF8265
MSPLSKRRRFFKDEDSFQNSAESNHISNMKNDPIPISSSKIDSITSSSPNISSSTPSSSPPPADKTVSTKFENTVLTDLVGPQLGNMSLINRELFESVSSIKMNDEDFQLLSNLSDGDITLAMNAVLDGTFDEIKKRSRLLSNDGKGETSEYFSTTNHKQSTLVKDQFTISSSDPLRILNSAKSHSPKWSKRYIGCFQVDGWAIRSGRNLIKYGDKIILKRNSRQAILGKRSVAASQKARENDIMVKFALENGIEIGRLPSDQARFVSTLLDLKICSFTGTCIFAEESLKTGDNIYLQLECYLHRDAFIHSVENMSSSTPAPSQSPFGIAIASESGDELTLRLRQLALVKLFMVICLKPVQTNDLIQKHQNRGTLEAEAMAEQFDVRVSEASASREESEPDTMDENQLDALYRKAQEYDSDMPEQEPFNSFNMKLWPYQKQGLKWMISRELGSDAEDARKINSLHPLWEEYEWPTQLDGNRIEENDNKFYVNPYNGELSLEFPKMCQTNYGGILADEMGLGKTISTMALIHSSPYDETQHPGAEHQRAKDFAPTTTLIVAPMSLLTQWEAEAKAASKQNSITVVLYYGEARVVDLRQLCVGRPKRGDMRPIVVITSFGMLSSEWTRKGSSDAELFNIHFLRVVLDEAHTIRNRASQTARACYDVQADRRWALTGTPIVNRLEDLYSLIKFLRVEPWSHFPFWRTFVTKPFEAKSIVKVLDVVQSVLEPLLLRRTKTMKDKNGNLLVSLPAKTVQIEKIQFTEPERKVYNEFYRRAKQTFNARLAAGTVMKSYTTIFAQILRLRQSCDHPLLVQSQIPKDEADSNGDEEEKSNESESGVLDQEDNMNLKELISKFNSREEEMSARDAYGLEVLQQLGQETERECPICTSEPIEDKVVTSCWHMSCRDCLLGHIKFQRDHGQTPRCHSCRSQISEENMFEVLEDSDQLVGGKPDIRLRRYKPHSSAKISRLLVKLKSIRKDEPGTKSVVFSQFTSFLDIIEKNLHQEKFKFLRIDGMTQQKQRAYVLDTFKNAPGEMVLLLSLKTGGVGLNLVTASKVFMMDPWWSYAVESQAIDRIHRMGQTQNVNVYRFIVSDSVEERMLKIQERKKFLASSLGMMTDEQQRGSSIEDFKMLFDLDIVS